MGPRQIRRFHNQLFLFGGCKGEQKKLISSMLQKDSRKVWLIPHRIEIFLWLALMERLNKKHNWFPCAFFQSPRSCASFAISSQNHALIYFYTVILHPTYGDGGLIYGISFGYIPTPWKRLSYNGLSPPRPPSSRKYGRQVFL